MGTLEIKVKTSDVLEELYSETGMGCKETKSPFVVHHGAWFQKKYVRWSREKSLFYHI